MREAGHRTVGAQGKRDGPAQEHGVRAESERDEHIAAAADATIEVDLGAPVNCLGHFFQGIGCRDSQVQLAAVVVGHPHRCATVLDGAAGVLWGEHPLHHHGERGPLAQLGEVVPGEGRVVSLRDDLVPPSVTCEVRVVGDVAALAGIRTCRPRGRLVSGHHERSHARCLCAVGEVGW